MAGLLFHVVQPLMSLGSMREMLMAKGASPLRLSGAFLKTSMFMRNRRRQMLAALSGTS
jgi:hypothetical protein